MQISQEVIMWFLGGMCAVLASLLAIIWHFLRSEVRDLKERIKLHEEHQEKKFVVVFDKLDKNQQMGHDNDASIQSHDAKFAAVKERMDNTEAQVRDLVRDDRRR